MTALIREKLERHSPALGLSVQYGTPGIIETIGRDWDWVWIDGQHGRIDDREADRMVMACDLVGSAAVVRVAANDGALINRALDTDCAAVIVPQVDTPDEARQAVRAAKFPPLGDRSFGGRRVIDRGGLGYAETANADRMLIVQVESPEAVANADAIAAVDGVDALFLGPDDLRLRRGQSLAPGSPSIDISADQEAVAEACRAHDKIAVTVGGGVENVARLAAMGYAMIVVASDVVILRTRSPELATACHQALGQERT